MQEIWSYPLNLMIARGLPLLLLLACCGRTEPFTLQSSSPSAPADPESPAPKVCGDGVVDEGEECDDGNSFQNDACLRGCKSARCGDKVIFIGVELCDDGNNVNGDTCAAQCGYPGCGDGALGSGEECDDQNASNSDGCLSSCLRAFCGDGFLRAGFEQCDDGNKIDDDGCDLTCALPVCGDGKREGAEECDLGAQNGDRPAFLITQPSGTSVATNPIVRSRSSTLFYDYRSASSHTGLEQVGESRIYLYVDALTGRLSLVLTHGIDFDSTGLAQPVSSVEMDVAGLPPGFRIDLADDVPSEFFASGPSSALGRWNFDRNSDGGVLGGLPFPGSWKITVTPRFQTGIVTWGWVRDDLQRIPLARTETITIEAFALSSSCRKSCTIPRCGDGRLDGGEVCDDANTVTGDGCAGDCKSLR